MFFLRSIFINAISFIIAFVSIKNLILKNRELFNFIDYFNIYGASSFLLLCFYLKYLSNSIYFMEIIIFIIITFYYLRSFNTATQKYHERFKITILSLGNSKKTYFNNFLSKKILSRGFEAYLFAVSLHYFLDKLFYSLYVYVHPLIIVMPAIILFLTALVKSSKVNKIYKILKWIKSNYVIIPMEGIIKI